MTKQTLREQYLSHFRNQGIVVISFNGFQLHGELTQFDDSDLILNTREYGDGIKEVLCANFLAVVPHTQPQKISYQIPSAKLTKRQKYLENLKDTRISCIASNGFRLTGILVAYDERDIIVETERYGGSKHVLLTNFSTVLPEE